MSSTTRSSFYWAMRLLPRHRREAVFAVYGYCRALDDIADGPDTPAGKRAALDRFRRALDQAYGGGEAPQEPAVAALLPAITRHHLPRPEFEALIDGMDSDVNGSAQPPTQEQLRLYCRQVAGSVGMLIVHIFGRPDAAAYAVATGEALQLTNILRDVAEDAALGRIYLPCEILDRCGLSAVTPALLPDHPRMAQACRMLADQADARFAEADGELRRIGSGGLLAARIMSATYRRQLARLRQGNWRCGRLSGAERLWIAVKVAAARAA